MTSADELERVRRVARSFPGLRLLVLHGSRARADATTASDWDFAYLGDPGMDDLELRSRLVGALRQDDLDLADLSHSGGLLSYRVARDGVLVFEKSRGAFEQFCCEAAAFWFDVEPVIRAEHQAILAALG